MSETIMLTHKGRWGLCPIYLRLLDGDGVAMKPRCPLYWPLFWLTELCQPLVNAILLEPAFMIFVGPELKEPIAWRIGK